MQYSWSTGTRQSVAASKLSDNSEVCFPVKHSFPLLRGCLVSHSGRSPKASWQHLTNNAAWKNNPPRLYTVPYKSMGMVE
uniref:Uncharacterized protein n=1 Tax=Anguilla anguilla TaxID=7936 RepID=A0A0E9Q926_ANGAN